jgi:hypothetical protein
MSHGLPVVLVSLKYFCTDLLLLDFRLHHNDLHFE